MPHPPAAQRGQHAPGLPGLPELRDPAEQIAVVTAGLGLGACWVIAPCIDIRDEERMKALLGIPEEYKAVSVISIGHQTRVHRPRPRLPTR